MKQTLFLATSIAAAGILLSPAVASASTAYAYGTAPSATATSASATYESGVDQNRGCDPQFSSENEPGDCCNDQQWRNVNQQYCNQFNVNDIALLT